MRRTGNRPPRGPFGTGPTPVSRPAVPMELSRRAPQVAPADAAAAETWYDALKTADPDAGIRAFWQAVDVICDVVGTPRDEVATAIDAPEGSPVRSWFEAWFCYGLHLVRSGVHGPGTVQARPVRRSSFA